MTTIEPYIIDAFLGDTRITLTSDFTDSRLDALAEHFWGRKFKNGYIFTPHRGMLFDRIYRAGFEAKDGQLRHPRIPGRRWSSGQAIQAIFLAEKIGA